MAEKTINPQGSTENKPRRLDEGEAQLSALGLMPFSEFYECVVYVVDTAATLESFFDIYPPAGKIFTLENVGPKLARFFDATYPVLKEELVRRNKLKPFEPVFSMLRKRLSYAKLCAVKVFRCLLQQSCLQPLIELGEKKEAEKGIPYIESFLDVISECLTEKHFIVSYQQRYPVEEDFGMFEEYNFFVDTTRALYILQSISSIYTELGYTTPSNLLNAQDAAANPEKTCKVPAFRMTNGSVPAVAATDRDKAGPIEEELGACGGEPLDVPSVELRNLIELFPNFSEALLKDCLECCGNNLDVAAMALADSNLPPSLTTPSTSTCTALDVERQSTHDNDESDMLKKIGVDLSKIHIGKEDDTPKSDDKGRVKILKEICKKYGILQEVVDNQGLYEDEYDDTYDSHYIGIKEPTTEDELFSLRRQGNPRGYEHEDSHNVETPLWDQFAENPAQRDGGMEPSVHAPCQRGFRGGARGRGRSRGTFQVRGEP